jgi:hypothetical protein
MGKNHPKIQMWVKMTKFVTNNKKQSSKIDKILPQKLGICDRIFPFFYFWEEKKHWYFLVSYHFHHMEFLYINMALLNAFIL